MSVEIDEFNQKLREKIELGIRAQNIDSFIPIVNKTKLHKVYTFNPIIYTDPKRGKNWEPYNKIIFNAILKELRFDYDFGVQDNASQSHHGVVRGLHFEPMAKLIKCDAGRIRDIIVDLDPNSPTCGQWIEIILDATQITLVLIPVRHAHAFEVLTDYANVSYKQTLPYNAKLFKPFALNFRDPILKIGFRTENPIFSGDEPGTKNDAGCMTLEQHVKNGTIHFDVLKKAQIANAHRK